MKFSNIDYSADSAEMDANKWAGIMDLFEDANIYQTWAYGSIKMGENNISHLVLRKRGEIVAAAQSWIFKLPLIKIGIAFVKGGPLWQRTGSNNDPADFRHMIRALKHEYVRKQKLMLRILPLQSNLNLEPIQSVLQSEGFAKHSDGQAYTTIIVDITPSIEDLRLLLKAEWRRNLKRAEQNNLEIIEGTGEELFKNFIRLYHEMVNRKKFYDSMDVNALQAMQKIASPSQKMMVFISQKDGQPVAAVVVSALGSTALYLHGATGKLGLDSRGSYLVHWRAVEWLKQSGCSHYDLNGIDPRNNPGGYQFKSGLSGKQGVEESFEEFEIHPNQMSLVIIRVAEYLNAGITKVRQSAYQLKSNLSGEFKRRLKKLGDDRAS
jgi:lipid II:glycine glycyltransferase (peptidoglycan interpeptide bridge formation enzyme)